jgi:hypothetical protein
MKFTRILLLTAACAGLAFGQAKAEPEAKSVTAKAAKEQEPSSPAKGDSIAVHGHWVLEIWNPDGSLASRHEFENSLQSGAGSLIGQVLTQARTPGSWIVGIDSGPNDQFLAQNAGTCTALGVGTSFCTPSLTTQVPNNGTGFVLQGSTQQFPASSSGATQSVFTYLETCPIATAAPTCLSSPTSTGAPTVLITLTAPSGVTVATGQIVTVTVTITFS